MSRALELKQPDRADAVLKYADMLGIRQIARLDCGCWRVMFATGTYREHNCGGAGCWGKRIMAIRRWQKDWPKDCPCGRVRLLVAESRAAARDGDVALHERLRAERLAHWRECQHGENREI